MAKHEVPFSRFKAEARALLTGGSPDVIRRLLGFASCDDDALAMDACRTLLPFMVAKPEPESLAAQFDDRGLPRIVSIEELRVFNETRRLLAAAANVDDTH